MRKSVTLEGELSNLKADEQSYTAIISKLKLNHDQAVKKFKDQEELIVEKDDEISQLLTKTVKLKELEELN